MTKDDITRYRRALAQEFNLRLVDLDHNTDLMVGKQPFADLYNDLAKIHGKAK